MENKKTKIVSIISIIALVLTVVTATYAYFQAQTGEGAQTDVKITANTVDTLTFETGSAISLSINQENFAEGKGNQSGTTFAKAMLTANNKTNNATEHYYLYLNIDNNTFTYTQNENTPEILLTIKDSSNNEITSISGLTYKTLTDASGASIKGFDITIKTGLITLLNNREITTTSTKTDTWNVTITFINYNADQSANAGKSFSAKLIIQKEEYKRTLAEYVKSQYTGTQGENNIYYHTSTLTNGAKDNSYRYAGGDAHPAYYSCSFAGKEVKNYDGETNKTLQGDCSSISKFTYKNNNIYYYDKSINKIKDTVSWDSVNNKCLTSSGEEVTESYDGEINETMCTGDAYKFYGKWKTGYTVENVGAGQETLYSPEITEDMKNFVCFGSIETPCPIDNLYRIIGVIDNKVKLIKYEYANNNLLGTDGDYRGASMPAIAFYIGNLSIVDDYFWNYKATNSRINTWSTSLLNKTNLNTNFINNIGSEWANKIATTTWKVGGNTVDNIYNQIASGTYQNEIVVPVENTTYDAKIGLMYASDYGFAASPSAWTKTLYNYGGSDANGTSIRTINWMYMGASEWTISRVSDNSEGVFIVIGSGIVTMDFNNSYGNGVRPSFSLESSVTYVSGTGTMSDPILIN